MDRTLDKLLDKIQKFKQKGQYQKARIVLEEISGQMNDELAVASEAVGLSFLLDPWMESLKRLTGFLSQHSFMELCGAENREGFLKLIHEHGGFVTGLTENLLGGRDLESIAGWMNLSDNYDQRWLVKTWNQAAETAPNTAQSALLHIAAGVGLFVIKDWDGAWKKWETALVLESRLLKKIMAFCQQPGRLDNTKMSHRLRLIKLIAAAGRKSETLTLLKALGLEKKENALKVLNEISSFTPLDLDSKDVMTLRFTLALSLMDPEILGSVIETMSTLPEGDMFRYKKMALQKITNLDVKRGVMLHFVKLYFDREEWEPAGRLLESLYIDAPHQEIVGLMEQVLDRYPIMSQLHFTAGKFYLGLGNYDRAIFHLGTIQQVEEYSSEICNLLEEHLTRSYDGTLAEMLLGMLEPTSHRAGLLAAWLLANETDELEKHISLWAQPKFREDSSPFWYLGLINSYCQVGRFDEVISVLARFLHLFPTLSPEALRPAESLAAEHRADFTELTRAVEDNLNLLSPRNAWSSIRMRYIEETQKYKAQKSQDPRVAAGPLRPMPEPKGQVSPELKSQFARFKSLLDGGNWAEAARVAELVAETFPQSAANVLRYLESLAQQFPQHTLWTRSMLLILNRANQFEKAIDVGSQVLLNPGSQSELPEIYQLMADAYTGLGGHGEALRFYCLASRSPGLYVENRDFLADAVLPGHPQFLKDIMQLVVINEDQDIWEILMKNWHHHRPEDIDFIIKAQITFTNQMMSTQAILDLAYWYLQAGRADEVNQTLNRLDLADPEMLEPLIRIVNLVTLKFPADPKPKFLLGKYYLVQEDVSKAVDTFREVARKVPNSAEAVYHHLRTFLRQNPKVGNRSRLYGLLIRFSLDYGSPLASVKLLDEFNRQNREGAMTLVDGVYRVILRKKGNLEAAYELVKLLQKWGDWDRVFSFHDQGDFGTHMAQERFRWFEEARAARPDLKERANLTIAQLNYEIYEFEKCRHALSQIENPSSTKPVLELYDKLTARFPDQMDLWREAGWLAFPTDSKRAVKFFEKVFEHDELKNRTEAYAILTELGKKPDLGALLDPGVEMDKIYSGLRQACTRVREAEISYWQKNDDPVPLRVLQWLVDTGQWARYEDYLPRLENTDSATRAILEANRLQILGQWTEAAWRLSAQDVPIALKQSYFYYANLLERAVLAGGGQVRLPSFIRAKFLETHDKPKVIQASLNHLRHLQQNLSIRSH